MTKNLNFMVSTQMLCNLETSLLIPESVTLSHLGGDNKYWHSFQIQTG